MTRTRHHPVIVVVVADVAVVVMILQEYWSSSFYSVVRNLCTAVLMSCSPQIRRATLFKMLSLVLDARLQSPSPGTPVRNNGFQGIAWHLVSPRGCKSNRVSKQKYIYLCVDHFGRCSTARIQVPSKTGNNRYRARTQTSPL